MMFDQLSNGPGICLLSSQAFPVDLELVSHLLVPIRLKMVHCCSSWKIRFEKEQHSPMEENRSIQVMDEVLLF